MQRRRDDRADAVDRLDLLEAGGAQVRHIAEVHRDVARGLQADVANAERDQQPP